MRKVNKFFSYLARFVFCLDSYFFLKLMGRLSGWKKETEIIKERLEEKKVTKIEKPIDDRPDYVKTRIWKCQKQRLMAMTISDM